MENSGEPALSDRLSLQEALKSSAPGDRLKVSTTGASIEGEIDGTPDAQVKLRLADGRTFTIYRNSCRVGEPFWFEFNEERKQSNGEVTAIDLIKKDPQKSLPTFDGEVMQVLGVRFEDLKVAAEWPLSKSLALNSFQGNAAGYAALELKLLGQYPRGGYQCIKHALAYAAEHPDQRKFEFINDSPNIGWKAHLNVPLDKVQEVADYLTQNGYYHKFLVGGEVENGKVFTIYFGSRVMVNKWCPQIANDLSGCLAQPVEKTEVELARGVIGRFGCREKTHDSSDKYTPYGHMGLPLLRGQARSYDRNEMTRYLQNPSEEELHRVFDELNKDFGAFFSGATA